MKKRRLITGTDLQVHPWIELLPGGAIRVRGIVVRRGQLAKGRVIHASGIKISRKKDPDALYRYELADGAWTLKVRFILGLWLEELK